MNKSRKPASESLQALHEFLLEPEEDIRAIPSEAIKAELKREGVDTDRMVREIRKRLAHARGVETLEKARAKKAELLSKIVEIPAAIGESVRRTRDEVLTQIDDLLQRHPALVGVQFRKLEQTTDEDLERLLHDLEIAAAMDEGDDQKQP
jgi:hypothetical protein